MNQRLERKMVKEEPDIMKLLKSDIVLRIKFYIIFFGALFLFLLLCFLAKGPTYGYL